MGDNFRTYKTIRCHYDVKGFCMNGTACTFLHSEDMGGRSEDHAGEHSESRTGTIGCIYFVYGLCKKGESCTYIHDHETDGIDTLDLSSFDANLLAYLKKNGTNPHKKKKSLDKNLDVVHVTSSRTIVRPAKAVAPQPKPVSSKILERPAKPIEKSMDPKTLERPGNPKTRERSINKTPEKPVDQEIPVKPVDPETPEKPVDQEIPMKPVVDPETPEKPDDAETPEKPVDLDITVKSTKTRASEYVSWETDSRDVSTRVAAKRGVGILSVVAEDWEAGVDEPALPSCPVDLAPIIYGESPVIPDTRHGDVPEDDGEESDHGSLVDSEYHGSSEMHELRIIREKLWAEKELIQREFRDTRDSDLFKIMEKVEEHTSVLNQLIEQTQQHRMVRSGVYQGDLDLGLDTSIDAQEQDVDGNDGFPAHVEQLQPSIVPETWNTPFGVVVGVMPNAPYYPKIVGNIATGVLFDVLGSSECCNAPVLLCARFCLKCGRRLDETSATLATGSYMRARDVVW